MRATFASARSLKFIALAEAALIIYLVALFLYFLSNIGQSSQITITPVNSTTPAITVPNSAHSPAAGQQQPASSSATNQPVFNI